VSFPPRCSGVAIRRGFWRHPVAHFLMARASGTWTRTVLCDDSCDPGNPSLRPERSRTYYAGFSNFLDSDKFASLRRLLHNRFRDIIVFCSWLCDSWSVRHGVIFLTLTSPAPRGVNFSRNLALPLARHSRNYSYDDTRVSQIRQSVCRPGSRTGNSAPPPSLRLWSSHRQCRLGAA